MSTNSFKGVPMEEIYGGHDKWHLNHLPPIQNKRDHIVLFQLPIAKDTTVQPKPRNGEEKWDENHVKLPCALENQYTTESSDDLTKTVNTSRWEIIQNALLQDITSSRALEQAILEYNHKCAEDGEFSTLHTLFEQKLDADEVDTFFQQTLPDIIRMALQLPELVSTAIPLLKRGENKSISLSQQQIACLLANAFLCTFPQRIKNLEYASFPTINFNGLFQTNCDQNIEKINCIINYLRRVCTKMPTGVVTFTRRSVSEPQLPQWEECQTTFADSLLHVSDDGTIEDDGEGLLQADFANKFVGGNIFGRGCVQEEIRFMICPELLCSRLFTEALDDNECLVIMGCERYSYYTGYGPTFMFTGSYLDTTPFDEFKRRKCTIVAIDAVRFGYKGDQYREDMLQRELNKAFIGFKHDLDSPAPGVATGNWGCGVFNGDKHLKSLLQLMACCVTKRPLVYYTFGDVKLRNELFIIYEYLTKSKVKIADLWSWLLEYADQRSNGTHLYDFIIACHQDLKNQKPSADSQCSKQANESEDKISPMPKSQAEPKATSKADEVETKQHDIEDSDDSDDGFDEEEALVKAHVDYRKSKPCATRRDFWLPDKNSMNEASMDEKKC